MENIEKIDNKLYLGLFGIKCSEKIAVSMKEALAIWNGIKDNSEILEEAVKIKRNKWDNGDTLVGTTIADMMLKQYDEVEEKSYNKLIENIYSNTDIARIVVDGYSNGGFSFLLMSLWNHNLKLTEDQKQFAVEEAMNKIGSLKYENARKEYSKYLTKNGITDSCITTIDIDGCVNQIGAKSGVQYLSGIFDSLSTTQAHGKGAFDIRYHILRNPNWTEEEKSKLVMDFWFDDEDYDNTLEQWELSILNDCFRVEYIPPILLEQSELYNHSYDFLLSVLEDKKTTDSVWEEIEFCRLMHQLRPAGYEKEWAKQYKKRRNK